MYDPQLGRWHVVDPMAEIYLDMSPYNYVLNNPLVRGNLELLNLLIVQTGVPDDCFVIRVTGGDRYRDPNNPTVHRSSSNGSIVKDSSPTSPHLIERGARAVDFNIDNVQDPCACTVPVTNQRVDRLLLSTNCLRTAASARTSSTVSM